MKRQLPIIGLTIALAWPCSARGEDPRRTVDDFDRSAVALAIDATVQRHALGTFWGGVVVTHDGEIVLAKGYGLANEDLDPITADSLFDIGSNAKAFTATAVLLLENDGVLTLDDPVAKLFPDTAEASRGITLRHLLTHTSGLSDRTSLQRLDFPDRDEAVRLALAPGPSAEPGTRFQYCNAGYVVLAAVVEKASGKPFELFMQARVFAPAGMVSTGFLGGVGIDPSLGTARVVSGGPGGGPARRLGILQDGWGWGLRGAGGMLTTLNDLVSWQRALARGTILDEEATEVLFRVERSKYALGWFVDRTALGGRKIHHGGSTRGFRSEIALYPDDDVMIAVLTNTQWDPGAIEQAVAAAIWPEERRDVEAMISVEGLALNEHGVATLEDGFTWRAASEGPRVVLQLTAEPGGDVAARIAMPRPVAAQLSGSIDDVVGANVKQDAGRGTSTVLGTLVYSVDESGSIRLPPSVTWRVMPQYRGVDAGGRPVVDERTTLVLSDDAAGFWPIIIRMEPAEAARLARAIDDAIEAPDDR